MVTAESKTDNVIAAKRAGVDNYIVKPFNAKTLQHKIEAVFPDQAPPPPQPQRVSRSDSKITSTAHHASCRITARRIDARLGKYRAERIGVGIVALAQLFGVDAGGHEQAVDAEGGRALEIGAHRIADCQHARCWSTGSARLACAIASACS